MHPLQSLIARHQHGIACGVTSICSAHPLVIEAARSGVDHHNQPSFAEVFDGMRGR